jgi:hypothetical protein
MPGRLRRMRRCDESLDARVARELEAIHPKGQKSPCRYGGVEASNSMESKLKISFTGASNSKLGKFVACAKGHTRRDHETILECLSKHDATGIDANGTQPIKCVR